ncbi:PREDICTED: pentatricopeptide repeat-containing protein At2g41080 [Tarenaya hassleriana]|uniref:pentatricopeptide repeat-containing protein At2g41080 n=1 Tax=Tarenaya hassleriana TaxID=28532 RepID=UPI00053C9DA9|nr:PREDICTED: pentatricopeptide repeat-containing protein At2g41080 [Tarenaya hassleriana]
MGKASLAQLCALRRLSTISARDRSTNEIATLCSEGNLREAFQRFRQEIWNDPSLFTHFIQSCARKASVRYGKQLHCLVLVSGFSSDKFICNHLMNMYSKHGDLPSVVTLYGFMPKRNVMSCNILINGYLRAEDLNGARKVFDEMAERNLETWNAMIKGLIHLEYNEEGLALFREMHELGFSPDVYTLGSVFRGLAGLRSATTGQQVHSYAIKCGLDFDTIVSSSIAHMYMRSGRLQDGEKVIKSMPILNVVAWNTLIGGNSQNGCPETVLYLYKMMKNSGCRPDQITSVSVLSSCSDLAILGLGKQIHAEAIKIGANSVVGVVSSLISMYARCGCLDDSVKAFSECDNGDDISWSSMMSAYGFHGKGEDAIKLFRIMEDRRDLKVNEVAFLNVLSACSHSGLKDEGLELFDSMVKTYGLNPNIRHYTCVVDLLSRSGDLDKAEDMIRSMPVEPDTVIWKTLLSACKTHKNTEMAKRVAKEILRLDPHDSACYVLMGNIHAAAERWDDVSEERKAIRDRNMKKEPGLSWFEHKGEVHQFRKGDLSHPRSEEVYLFLRLLAFELRLKGYVPDTASVLHEIDIVPSLST